MLTNMRDLPSYLDICFRRIINCAINGLVAYQEGGLVLIPDLVKPRTSVFAAFLPDPQHYGARGGFSHDAASDLPSLQR